MLKNTSIFDGEKASYQDAVDAFQWLYRNKSEEIFEVIWGNITLRNNIWDDICVALRLIEKGEYLDKFKRASLKNDSVIYPKIILR